MRAEAPLTCPAPPPGWRCTREVGHGGPCAAVPTRSVADSLYEASAAAGRAEEALADFLDGVLGEGGWCGFDHDRTDRSVEVYGVPPRVELSGDGLTMFRVAGFDRVWLHEAKVRGMPNERYYGIK